MLHSLSKDTAFTGETAPRHIFLCSDSQCLPPGDPRTLCAKHGYLITGKSFFTDFFICVFDLALKIEFLHIKIVDQSGAQSPKADDVEP